MKNKKLLLIATAAMGVVALGVAGVGTAAWFTASANVSATMQSDTANVTVATTSAVDAGLKFTVDLDETNSDLTGVQITNSSGETKYYDTGTSSAVVGSLTKGYATAVFDISVSLTGSSSLTLQQALKIYYDNMGVDKNVYLRVTDSGQAVVSTTTGAVYSSSSENDQALTEHRTVTIALALASDGSTNSWADKTVYVSVRNQAANDGAYNAATYTAGITATVGSSSANFTAAA